MDSIINFNDSLKRAIEISQALAKEYSNEHFSPSHLLRALMHKDVGLANFLKSLDKDIYYIEEWADVRIGDYPRTTRIPESPAADEKVRNVIEESDYVRIKLGLDLINPICVLAALSKPGVGFTADQLKTFPLKEKEIYDLFINDSSLQQAVSGGAEANASGDTPNAKGGAKAALYKYCVDKTAIAREGKMDPIIGRDKEIRMMIEILGRRSKPNVIIVGEPGVGKTALVDGFAINIVNGHVPTILKNAYLFELDLGAVIAGASYKGEIEDRLKNIIKEIKQFDKAVLFIDEIHVLLDPKGPMGNSAANLLKPELARGEITVIGATTNEEYRQYIESDQAFSRRFEVVKVDEPDITTTIKMLTTLLPNYENHHQLKIDKEAVIECVKLSKRYIKDRRLPDAAIDLLDRTMASIRMMEDTSNDDLALLTTELETIINNTEHTEPERLKEYQWFNHTLKNRISPILLAQMNDETDVNLFEVSDAYKDYLSASLEKLKTLSLNKKDIVEKQDIASVISYKTGIPLGKIQAQEKERLLNMDEFLKKRVVGQDHALKAIADAVLESRSGLNKAGQPIGSFFFLGPTGTGKTEVAKSIAEFLFNDENAMIRFDMSEFKEEHSAALLYGAPPGYVGYEEGGMLVNKIREKPYSVVLFDEIEKAHPSVFDIFLQILDEGKMHDRLGKEGDFSNSLILFTSNIGAEWIIEKFGEGIIPKSNDLIEIMTKYFRPEFLARLTEVVPFAPISEQSVVRILEIHMKGLLDLLHKQGITLTISPKAMSDLALSGFNPKYGARPLNGVIRNQLRRPISKMIVSGSISKGNQIALDILENGELDWKIS